MKAKVNLIPKALLGTISFLMIIVLFLWLSAIHEVIEDGNAFGFSIGMSKAEVFANLQEHTEKNIEAINLVSADNKSSKRGVLSSNTHDFYASDKWVVMFESAYFFDSVTLEFCSGHLCKIFRKRQYLEMP
ncbi:MULTISPECIES: hypothetical protein [Shewanella]|jgi:hypothetical protein|uniref:Uncharacterized protein n=1 Tax=Shewanella ulleungensis TaxID=2282699 RepID=A0ABQ2QR52_9GAMM|nr:hypothetical protein [Shewanella ulleungensis]MCL1151541.1 hypothetical protein [Shewanella ulleungensis]GGP89466.1 hypothetical protein GCM10009410_24160 [Shewanella ulleungensis]